MKLKLVLATLALSLTTLAVTPAMAGDTQKAIEAARSAQKEAKAVGFEWRDMGKMIKKAENLLKPEKTKKQLKLRMLL